MRRNCNRIQKLQKQRISKHFFRKEQQKNEKQELQMRSVLREFLLKKSIWNFLRKRNSALSVVPRWKKSGKSLSAGNWFLYRQNWKYMNTTVRAMSARSAGFRIFRLSKKEKMAELICFMEWLLPERLPGFAFGVWPYEVHLKRIKQS